MVEHERHHGWAMDVVNSERIRAWTVVHLSFSGCFGRRTYRTMDVLMMDDGRAVPIDGWTSSGLGHEP